MSKIPKTVYVLGAGFSIPAGAPDQSRLVKLILNLDDLQPEEETAKQAFRAFLVEVMKLDPSTMEASTLEDIYTPIDRCLADGVSFRGKSVNDLKVLRGQMEYLISLVIDRAFIKKRSEDQNAWRYIRDFADIIVDLAAKRGEMAKAGDFDGSKAYDPISIISLNWDIALDNAIFKSLDVKDNGADGGFIPIGVVDYCCYISSKNKYAPRIQSGLWTLGAKGYNVKLLKIHGSMNWLQCTNCQRLFVDFNEKQNIPNFLKPGECRHCGGYKVEAKLQGSLVMPTFLKDLSNFQIKLVWQNTGVELMEADRIVFIGYSLPHADFEFKQLLSRMVRDDTAIDVVLFEGDTAESKQSYANEIARYRQFFGSRKVTELAEGKGVVEFVNGLKQRATSTVV